MSEKVTENNKPIKIIPITFRHEIDNKTLERILTSVDPEYELREPVG